MEDKEPTKQEIKIRKKIWREILNKALHEDNELILIRRGNLYMSVCNLAEEFK